MVYNYKFLPDSNGINKSVKDAYIESFQESLNQQFYNSTDWFTITEETSLASGAMQDVDVRITKSLDSVTGLKLSDNWKTLLFKDLAHSVSLGRFYYFDSSWWLTVNSTSIKSLTSSVMVRRCNNVLRWIDTDGAYYAVPCVLDTEKIPTGNKDLMGVSAAVVTPMGLLDVKTQYNSSTNKIKPNQRFLFGNPDNWIAWKVAGGGIVNFDNLHTESNTSQGIIEFTLERNYDNVHTDDLVNGVARAIGDSYAITLSDSTISSTVATTIQLGAVVKLNDDVVDRTVLWTSSNTLKARVSSTGLVTMVAAGTATITATLSGNSSITSTCAVTVLSTPTSVYQIVVTPDENYILETAIQIFDVRLWLNNVVQADTFTFTVATNTIPSGHYTFAVLSSYTFYVQNVAKYMDEPVIIHCASGVHTKDITINLRGAW